MDIWDMCVCWLGVCIWDFVEIWMERNRGKDEREGGGW